MALKDRILEESLRLFSMKGFFGTSTSDILRACHTSKGGFYNHFSSKESLFFGVLKAARRHWREMNLKGLDEIKSPMGKIRLILENYRDRYLKDTQRLPGGCPFITLSVELADRSPLLAHELNKGFTGLKKMIHRYLEEGKQNNEISETVDTGAVTELIFAGMLGASLMFTIDKSFERLNTTINRLIEYLDDLMEDFHRFKSNGGITMSLPETFKALVVSEAEEKKFIRSLEQRKISDLPEGDVIVRVLYSSLNYKDALSATGNRGVTRNYPHTPGIDAAGVVVESTDGSFKPGDEVIVTSYDLGMNTSGGFGQYIRVPAGWVVPMPADLTAREAMIYGTAGFTAALSVMKLTDNGVLPENGDILVSGATGGVGGIAVSILAKIGYTVTAVNGLVDEADYLKEIGAKNVISIEEATDDGKRPLLKARWAGSIDTVGGPILACSIKSTAPGGTVTCCGNVASPELPINVYPFILRGVTLIGIDSQNCPMPVRKQAWAKLASDWKIDRLDPLTTEASLEDVDKKIDLMLAGKHRGRTIVKVSE